MARKMGGLKKGEKAPNIYSVGQSVFYKNKAYSIALADDGFVALENVGDYLFLIVPENEVSTS